MHHPCGSCVTGFRVVVAHPHLELIDEEGRERGDFLAHSWQCTTLSVTWPRSCALCCCKINVLGHVQHATRVRRARRNTCQSQDQCLLLGVKQTLILVQEKLKLRNGTPQSSSSSVRSSAAFLTS